MGSTLGCVASFSENVRWKLRDVLARWRALPKPTQWRVALSLSAVTIVAILFVVITIPQARFVDRLIERDNARMRAGG